MFLVRTLVYLGKQNELLMIFFVKNEVALGKECTITKDDSSLKKPPANYDSVVARGQTEPGLNGFVFVHVINSFVLCYYFKNRSKR